MYLLLYACVATGLLSSSVLVVFLSKRFHQRLSLPRRFWLLCFGLAGAFIVAELSVRLAMAILSSSEVQPTSFDRELGWSRPPANRVVVASESHSPGKDARVVFVGDSVAFGHGVPPQQGMVHQARLHLGGRVGPVLNAAVSGYGIDQTSLYSKRHLAAWENLKVLVVVVFAGNDLLDTAANMRYGHSKPLFLYAGGKLVQSSAGQSRYSLRNLISDSKLIYSFEALYPAFSTFVDGFSGKEELGERETGEVVRALLADLLHETKGQDATTLMVLIPAKTDLLAPSPSFLWFEGALKENDARLLNLLPLLKSQGVEADSLFLPGDPWHLSAEGNEIVGRLIAEAISKGDSP